MNVLLIGSGGREHALSWKIAQSSLLDTLYISPGNPGTERHARSVDLDLKDHEQIKAFIQDNKIEIIVVGPEAPLADGFHDRIARDPDLQKAVTVIGPTKRGAMLESSKEFAKAFMKRHGIPTAAYASFGKGELKEAIAHLDVMKPPYVIKADGLAAGKGVVITEEIDEAKKVIKGMLNGKSFGEAGERIVLEKYLKGREVSVFLLTDGHSFKVLPTAQDHKRINNGEQGPNTGGMGAVSPAPLADRNFMNKVNDRIIVPTIRGLQDEGIPYQGFIFLGLICVGSDPYVIEYNVRLGDPETQVVLPRLRSDLLNMFDGIATRTLSECHVDIDDKVAIGVVLASEGYPGKYETGKEISGMEQVDNAYVFQAGTQKDGDKLLTAGGRVMTVTAMGKSLDHAISNAYSATDKINFEGKYNRTDIGKVSLRVKSKPKKVKA